MKSPLEVFREFTAKKGLRNTPEREMIIDEMFAIHDHFDVDELYLRLKIKKKKVSKPSIYRLIPHLLESGLIQEAYFEEGHWHYEHIYGHEHHCHLRCLGCGKTIEFQEKSFYFPFNFFLLEGLFLLFGEGKVLGLFHDDVKGAFNLCHVEKFPPLPDHESQA